MLNFEGSYEKNDLLEAARVDVRSRAKILVAALSLAALAAFALAGLLFGNEPILLAIAPILIVLLFLVILVLAVGVRAASTYRTSTLLREPVRGSVSPTAVEITSVHSTGNLPWSVFYRQAQSEQVVLLYQSAQIYSLFPRRFFSDDREWARFRELVSLNVVSNPKEARTTLGVRVLVALCLALLTCIVLWNAIQS